MLQMHSYGVPRPGCDSGDTWRAQDGHQGGDLGWHSGRMSQSSALTQCWVGPSYAGAKDRLCLQMTQLVGAWTPFRVQMSSPT